MSHSGKTEEYMCVCMSYCATVCTHCEKASAYTQYGEVDPVAQSIVFLVYSSISNEEPSFFCLVHQSLV